MSLSYSPIFFLLGTILNWLVIVDVVSTNTTKIGEGILTKWWQQKVCFVSFYCYRCFRDRAILVWAGSFIVLGMVVLWILLLWLGWIAIFCTSENAVVSSSTQQPADFWARVYFAGFSISGLGTGDFVPQGAFWQVFTAVASLNGLVLTSLIIGFIVPIAQAEAYRRQIALQIFYTGQTAQDLLLHTWNPQHKTVLEPLLRDIADKLVKLDQNHASFPMLHRFCNYRLKESIILAIASLDEALTIAEFAMEQECSCSFSLARRAISGYLCSSRKLGIEPGRKVPPPPSLDSLRQAQILVVSDRLWQKRLESLQQRRQHLLSLVEQSGWSWKQVVSNKLE